MPSRHDPAECLADIVDNARRIEHYPDGVDIDAFAKNGMMRDAVERCLERICEAAHRLGPLAAELMPDQKWSDVRGMGNQLRRAYDRISLDVLWNTVWRDVPNLADAARRALAHSEPGQTGGD